MASIFFPGTWILGPSMTLAASAGLDVIANKDMGYKLYNSASRRVLSSSIPETVLVFLSRAMGLVSGIDLLGGLSDLEVGAAFHPGLLLQERIKIQ